ncbi:biosynthetic-type acetolactate synthase large subunit [Ethanoligenens harbinense]|uniref:Acetolactate synthase n=1 Tax=Ethanoligenens harbinense (strain DSM 18485 / JCM 12961 / CGMCC 1.5033 / YUAN-3) TaxID=663278 RepID=E6U3S1_ETHHY|nr:biosynthetic-type acetolactate synthase large subunit [Ethanoligenens harbinense]ADU26488.1 acetolactate synthase, large subunit, biosynthetic type [Ethanoligenens harbinense YUAN-3]AVQ97363.1 acetolactate synthase, large subunit, biosynthetic type [Ethanoligenens harbinense YUAN-3]AYF40022.1 acetolactate synthase, large subunit, biosynthetic type [Ethanoligenens harbinense]AYF42853.1 acetolactate synthase, large subunit, biosynthetic type [Ethanoligenens harbinense]QCN93613.1 biosynthetic-
MKMTGAQVVVNCLIEQGVDTVFGFPGGAVLNIYDALYEYQSRIRHILTCHEQGAAHAADGYARSTGRTGVVIATSGPGATNLVTGIATAYMDSVPMVAITGNVNVGLLGRDSFQEVDITGITAPVTKHNFIVKHAEELAPTLRRAFAIANSDRPGPVLIDIPKDITAAQIDYTPETPKPDVETNTPLPDLGEALDLLTQSQRPFIFAGGGAVASGACDTLAAFAEKIDAPVALSLMGLGSFLPESPRFTGMLGMHGSKASSYAVENCDLFIALGTRFSDRVLCHTDSFAKNAKILQIDIDPAEINKNIPVFASVAGDLGTILTALLRQLPDRISHTEWMKNVQAIKANYPIDRPLDGDTMPYAVLSTLHDLAPDAIVTTEVGQHQMWAGQYFHFTRPRHFLTSGGLGTMGFGLGAAIGAQVAHPGEHVINVAGDGSFFMNLNELATAVTYDLPVIELIMNNGVLGMVHQWQQFFYKEHYSHSVLDRQTDLSALARAFGALPFTIARPADIRPVLSESLQSGRPCVINCLIDPGENVLPMVPAGKPVGDPILSLEKGGGNETH